MLKALLLALLFLLLSGTGSLLLTNAQGQVLRRLNHLRAGGAPLTRKVLVVR